MITTDEVTGPSTGRHSKWCTVPLTYEALAKMLSLPRGCSIVSLEDGPNNTFKLKCIYTNIKDTGEGGEIPTLMPGQGGWTGSI